MVIGTLFLLALTVFGIGYALRYLLGYRGNGEAVVRDSLVDILVAIAAGTMGIEALISLIK